jgi:hypothetical protein
VSNLSIQDSRLVVQNSYIPEANWQGKNERLAAAPAIGAGTGVGVAVGAILLWYYASWASNSQNQKDIVECQRQISGLLNRSAEVAKEFGAEFKVPSPRDLQKGIQQLFTATSKKLSHAKANFLSAPKLVRQLIDDGVAGVLGTTKQPSKTESAQPQEMPIVSALPPDAKTIKKFWVDTNTGKTTYAKSGKGNWVEVHVFEMTENNNAPGGRKKIRKAKITAAKTTKGQGNQNDPNNQKPGGQDLARWAAIAAAFTTGTFVVGQVVSSYFQLQDSLDTAWEPTIHFQPIAVAKNLDVSSPEKRAAAIISAWKEAFLQVPQILAHPKNKANSAELIDAIKHKRGTFVAKLENFKNAIAQAESPEEKQSLLEKLKSTRITSSGLSTPGSIFTIDGVRSSRRTSGIVNHLVAAMNEGVETAIETIDARKPNLTQLGAIKAAVAGAQLLKQPNFSNLKSPFFAMDMFLASAKQADAKSIDQALKKVVSLQAKLTQIYDKETSTEGQQKINAVFLEPLAQIYGELSSRSPTSPAKK